MRRAPRRELRRGLPRALPPALLRDGALSVGSTGLRMLATLALFLVLAHAWGPATFGVFMFPFAIAAVVVKLVDYGFPLQLARTLGAADSAADAGRLVNEALAAKLLLVVPTGAIGAAVGAAIPGSGPFAPLLALLLVDAVLGSFALFLTAPLRAAGRFDAEARVTALGNATTFALVATAAMAGAGPLAVAGVCVGARALQLGVAARAYARVATVSLRPAGGLRTAGATLRAGAPYAAHLVVGTLNAQADTLVVQHYLGAEAVGLYQAGLRMLFGGMVVADALNAVFLARLARVVGAGADPTADARRMTRSLVALGLGMCGCALLAGPAVVAGVLTPAYAPLAAMAPLFGVLLLVRHLCVPYGTLLTLGGRQRRRVAGVTAALALSLAADVLLVPRFGVAGAVAACIVGDGALLAVYVAATRRDAVRRSAVWWSAARPTPVPGVVPAAARGRAPRLFRLTRDGGRRVPARAAAAALGGAS